MIFGGMLWYIPCPRRSDLRISSPMSRPLSSRCISRWLSAATILKGRKGGTCGRRRRKSDSCPSGTGSVFGEDLRKAGGENRAGQNPIAPGHGGLDFEVCLDVGEEADDRNVAEVSVLFDLTDRLKRLAACGIQVNDQERRLVCESPGDHLVLASREQERDAEPLRRLGDLAGEEEVVYRN